MFAQKMFVSARKSADSQEELQWAFFDDNDVDELACSWKEHFQNSRSRKISQWKVRNEIGKKLVTSSQSWKNQTKVTIAVEKFWIKLERSIKVEKSHWSKKRRLKSKSCIWFQNFQLLLPSTCKPDDGRWSLCHQHRLLYGNLNHKIAK